MLLLERKRNEKVKVVSPSGEQCFVQVIRDKGDKVVLGFQFPKDYRILRDELEPHAGPPTLVPPTTTLPTEKAA